MNYGKTKVGPKMKPNRHKLTVRYWLRFQPVDATHSPDFQPSECPLWSKADITNCAALANQQLWLPLATRTSK